MSLLFHKAKAGAEINPPKTKNPKIEKQKRVQKKEGAQRTRSQRQRS